MRGPEPSPEIIKREIERERAASTSKNGSKKERDFSRRAKSDEKKTSAVGKWVTIESENQVVVVVVVVVQTFQMRLSSSAIALVAFSVSTHAFVSSPSRLGCKHAKNTADGASLQSGLILQSTVEDVAATAGEETPAGLQAEGAEATQSSYDNDTIGLDKAEMSGGSQKPGMAENAKFQCEESVKFWQEFQRDGFWSAQENLRELGNVGTRFAQMGPEALSHWLVSCLFFNYITACSV